MKDMLFDLREISFAYPGGRAGIQSINLSITAGERVALLGPNGSGKSTLLKILDGLIFADGGLFKAFGRTITEELLESGDFAANFRRQIAFVFQDSDTQLFSPTVLEEVSFGPLQLDITPQEAAGRAREILEMMEISHLAQAQPHQLSGGEKKKVALAGSLATGPDVVLLDEPTSNLAPKTKPWLIALLLEMGSAGKTLILATQDLDVASAFASRVVILDDKNTIVAQGDPDSLLADREMLERANLIHEHWHDHDSGAHHHPHAHYDEHEHSHDRDKSTPRTGRKAQS